MPRENKRGTSAEELRALTEAPKDPGVKAAPKGNDVAHPQGVRYSASGRPMVHYGPNTTYPSGEAEDVMLRRIVTYAWRGKTFHAIARELCIPASTLRTWAGQPYGVKLRHVIGLIPDLVRGYFEDEARANTRNKSYNTALFGKLMAAQFPEYRSVGAPLDDKDALEKPEGMTDFEFDRRLMSSVERILSKRNAAPELPALPPPSPEEDV